MFLQNELLTRLLDELVADDSSGGFRDCRSYLGEAVRMHLPDRRNQITANCFSQLQRVIAFRDVPIVPECPRDVHQVCVVDRRRACATSYDDNDGIGDDEERSTTRPFDSSCRVAGQASPFFLVAALLTYTTISADIAKERNCITS